MTIQNLCELLYREYDGPERYEYGDPAKPIGRRYDIIPYFGEEWDGPECVEVYDKILGDTVATYFIGED